MSTLPVGFTCWQAESVAATIPTEAATPSDQVLLATHSPLRIRREGTRTGEHEFVSEQEVVHEFLTSTPNAGVLIAPVLGESGAGKSHLVRWANANIPRVDGRHVIYLQKTQTSLRDVVEQLLSGKTGPAFDEIRRQVSGLGTSISIEEMERRILAELAEALRSREPQGYLDKPLVGEHGLALLFLDPLFRGHLLRPGSFINRRAVYALNGRDPDEPDVPLEFTVDELPLDITDEVNLADASKAAQSLFRKILVNPQMQLEAVRILNDSLDLAVMKAANLGVGNVNRAFMKLREELVGDEIVLLIEDVALIQGVRRDLLDAIHESSIVRGQEKYATVRTLLAVTPSYYRENLPETFRTRAEASSPSYVVDVQIGGKTSDAELVDFVGRYLNAARLGRNVLESEMATKRVASNACDSCSFSDTCHSTFGTSEAGYGLYPYNESAVLRAVRACVDPDNPELFSPRRVLAGAIREVLMDAAGQLPRGDFPPGRLLGERTRTAGLPTLPLAVRQRLEEDYPKELAPRLESMLAFWGRAGTRPISHAVFETFGLDPITSGDGSVASDESRSNDGGDLRKPEAEDLPKSVQRQLEAIEDWSAKDKTLPQDIARSVRSLVREAVVARIEWFDPVIKSPDAETLRRAVLGDARGISIEGAHEGIGQGVEPIVRIQRTAGNAVLLQGLILIQKGFANLSGDALARLDALAVGAVPTARGRILATLEYSDDEMIEAARSLIIGALACGHIASTSRDVDLIRAVAWRGDTAREDADSRHPQWADSFRAYVAERSGAVVRFLRGIGAAQGDRGDVHALDSVRLTRIVKAARAQLDELPNAVPSWCTDANRKLAILIQVAPVQISHWTGLVERVRRLLPESESFVDTVDAVVLAAREGQAQGLVKVKDLAALEQVNDSARRLEARGIAEIEKVLVGASGQAGVTLARHVGTTAGKDLKRIAEYLEDTERWVESGIRDAEIDSGTRIDIDEAIESQVIRWMKIVTNGADNE